ncbi:MAG: hypothetical protein ACOCYE_07900 [Pseudomonadota bacterium]
MSAQPVICVARDRTGRIAETKRFPDAAAARAWVSEVLGDPRILQVEFVLPATPAPDVAIAAA